MVVKLGIAVYREGEVEYQNMGKAKKGPRQIYGLKCSVCNKFNYLSERNKLNTVEKLSLSKYCTKCKKHTVHKEAKKLK